MYTLIMDLFVFNELLVAKTLFSVDAQDFPIEKGKKYSYFSRIIDWLFDKSKKYNCMIYYLSLIESCSVHDH